MGQKNQEKRLPVSIPFSNLIGVWYKMPEIKKGVLKRLKVEGEE